MYLKNEIAVITDSDFGLEIKENMEPPKKRLGARGIVVNDKNEVAIFVKIHKNECKLPGGGIEENEKPQIAFIRECEEELGVDVKIEKMLGTIVEDKSQENFMQCSYVFVAKKLKDKESNNLTEQEKDEGGIVIWMKPEEALNKMNECLNNLKASKYDSIYRSKFMVLRDIKILEYYLKNR